MNRFYPDMVVDRIQDINLELLSEKGFKGLILDIDNTLVPSHLKTPDEKAVTWIDKVKNAGFKVCIVSNATKKRVARFNEPLNVFAIHKASKPRSAAFIKAALYMCAGLDEVAVIGDQIFTDIYGGKKLGMYTILVKPIDRREYIFVRLKRLPEKLILHLYKRKNV